MTFGHEEITFVDTSSKKVREGFEKTQQKKNETLKKIFQTSGVDLIDITTRKKKRL